MSYVPYKNGTLFIPSGPSGDHLFVIVTPECTEGCHLLVSFSSIKKNVSHDPTCILQPGAHPFIKQPTYMLYRMAQITPAAWLTKMVDGWVYRKGNDDASDELVATIRTGVMDSPFTPQRVVEYCAKAP